MQREPKFTFSKSSGLTRCILTDGDKEFVGEAKCNSADKDFISEKIGCNIALFRAQIKYYQYVRKDILKVKLAALNQLYYSMKHSSHFNPDSYEAKMLRRQISHYEDDIAFFTKIIDDTKSQLSQYLSDMERSFCILKRSKRSEWARRDKNNE